MLSSPESGDGRMVDGWMVDGRTVTVDEWTVGGRTVTVDGQTVARRTVLTTCLGLI